MSDAPKVTVYIAARNCAKYLEAAIESVLRQSMSDWELLVFDDNSTDKTPQILDLSGARPRCACSAPRAWACRACATWPTPRRAAST